MRLNLGLSAREQFLLELHNYPLPARPAANRFAVAGQLFTDSSTLLPHQHYLVLDSLIDSLSPIPCKQLLATNSI